MHGGVWRQNNWRSRNNKPQEQVAASKSGEVAGWSGSIMCSLLEAAGYQVLLFACAGR